MAGTRQRQAGNLAFDPNGRKLPLQRRADLLGQLADGLHRCAGGNKRIFCRGSPPASPLQSMHRKVCTAWSTRFMVGAGARSVHANMYNSDLKCWHLIFQTRAYVVEKRDAQMRPFSALRRIARRVNWEIVTSRGLRPKGDAGRWRTLCSPRPRARGSSPGRRRC